MFDGLVLLYIILSLFYSYFYNKNMSLNNTFALLDVIMIYIVFYFTNTEYGSSS